MAGINSLIEFLVRNDWSFKEIKCFLEQDHSSINEPDDEQRSPLCYLLKSSKCSKNIVKLMLQYGASMDSRDENGETPLICALKKYNRDEAIITELIEKGANVKVHDERGCSPLCLALYRRPSKDLIKILLKAGCSVQECKDHENVWHCFTEPVRPFESGFSEDVMILIIQAGADVNEVDSDGRSPLCHVLFNGAKVGDIKLLLSQGASFNDCKVHSSPLLCVTNGCSAATLKADVVELLLNDGASLERVGKHGCTSLQLALRYCRHETAAIRILLNRVDVNNNLASIKHSHFGNLLHFAASNRDCKLIIIKFLLQKGVRSDEINECGRIPLHGAMRSDMRDLRIIELLVRNGSPVNAKCKYGYTPLSLAVERQMQCHVLRVLLEAGAFIDGLTDTFGVPLLEQTLKQKWRIDCNKLLLKWLFIENPSFEIKSLTEGPYRNVELINFAEECVVDLKRMESLNIGHNITLSGFIRGYFPQNINNESKLNFDLDQLLRTISINKFLNFSDVISSKISKFLLIEKLQQLSIYTWKRRFDYPCRDSKVICNYDCLCEIAKYLTRQDLLCLILAFYFTCDYSLNG